MISLFHMAGVTSVNSRAEAFNIRTVGKRMNEAGAFGGPAGAGDPTLSDDRKTVGLDARWRVGAFGLDPTISYQWASYTTQGNRTNGTVGKVDGESAAWLFDV